MPKVEFVAALIRAIGSKDQSGMRRVVEQIIAHERGGNRESAAEKLEHALRSWPAVLQMVELPHSIKNLVWPEANMRQLSELKLQYEIESAINMFLRERRNYDVLHKAGLPVSSSILLAGPPGNGKTSLATALANELGMQLVSVKMHSLIDSHMGESGRNIGKIFEYAMTNDCLLFIDEFDAIGSQRMKDASNSGKEYNNIVTTLLTNIDRLPDTTLLIAATNMLDAIDPAIQRRFNLKLWLDNPTVQHIQSYIVKYQEQHDVSLHESMESLASELTGLPWSEVEKKCIDLHKELILGHKPIETEWIGKQTDLAI